ncbi:arginine--tRNA ligase [Patescibacteria group bacterium]|nr:arginine--tRNA ligase [Patescibacteria group bacterium]
MQDIIRQDLKNIVHKKFGLDLNIEVLQTEKKFGDYKSNIAFKIAQCIKEKPQDIAEIIKNELRDYQVNTVNGFINIWIKKEDLIKYLKKETLIEKTKSKDKIIIDYSSPNIAKPMNVSHLLSTIIGDSILRIHKYIGFDIESDNHIGDWGTQFGKLIYAIDKWGDYTEIQKDPIEKLLKLYIEFHKKEENNKELKDEAKKYFKLLSEKDPKILKIWNDCVNWSIQDFKRIYKILDIHEFTYILGESFYNELALDIVKKSLKDGIAKIEERAVVVYTKQNQKPLVLQKSDKTTVYALRDIATIKYRQDVLGKNVLIYEIGSDQKQMIEQMFEASKILGITKKNTKLILISHGILKLEGNKKLSTRKGIIIRAEDIINTSIERSKDIMNKNGITNDKSIKDIAIGAIKFNILKKHYSSDIIFNIDQMLQTNGNTSVYIQYVYVRCASILKNEKNIINFSNISFSNDDEINLARYIYKFQDAIYESKLSPNILTEYLLNLSKTFNSFYEKHSILKTQTEVRNTRLALTYKTMQIIKTGLDLLGINTIEKM